MYITEQKDYKEMMLKYNFALEILETDLRILIKECEYNKGYNPVEHIKTRIKTLESATKKLQEKGFDITVDNIVRKVYDMVGVRIVCSFLTDVYDVVNLIKNNKHIIIKREKNYIENPKESGYQSYHLIVLVPIHLGERTEYVEAEIQVRTVAMDCWASLDHKLRYKLAEESLPDEIINGLRECSRDMDIIDSKMEKLYQTLKDYNKANN